MKPAFRIAWLTGVAMAASASAQLVGPGAAPAAPKPAAKDSKPADPTAKAEPRGADIPALLKQLGDPSAAQRDEAERKLTYSGLTQDQLEQALQDPGASPEQRARLDRLGPAVIRSTPRGAMGISFKQGDLVVAQCHEGFECQKVLKADDQIVAVDRHPVSTIEELRPAIIMHPPGAEVPIRLIRDGRPMTVKLKLGAFDALPSQNFMRDNITNRQCERAWEMRSADLAEARRRAGREAVLDLGVSAEAWRRAAKVEPGARPSVLSWGDPTLVAAGQARSSGDDGRARPRLSMMGEGRNGRPGNDARGVNEDLVRIVELQRKLGAGNLDDAARRKLEEEIFEIMSRMAPDIDVMPRERRIP